MAGGPDIEVLDSINEDGMKLVRISDELAERLNEPTGPVRAAPVVHYPHPRTAARAARQLGVSRALSGIRSVTVSVEERGSGRRLPGVEVIAFTDFVNRVGDSGFTGANGDVTLALTGPTIERLYVLPQPSVGMWNMLYQNLATNAPIRAEVEPVNLGSVDVVRHYYGALTGAFDASAGVVVGVIDTGVGPHGHVRVRGGACTIPRDPNPTSYLDVDSHGTHVAGLIAASGAASGGLDGLAPGVDLYAYRVFPDAVAGATNFSIVKAIIRAEDDGCHIVNLSLGGGPFDHVVADAIDDAVFNGMVPVIAAGNDGRQPVSYPAAYNGAVAVSAMGHETFLPPDVLDWKDVGRPPFSSANSLEFLAEFSNVGVQIAVTGPGVGDLSTVPGGNNAYAPMSGTSMAAPVVAGYLANRLSQPGNAAILQMAPDPQRAAAIRGLLAGARRFQNVIYEGAGLPQ
jgi:subtilisin